MMKLEYKINLIKRNKCVLTNDSILEHLITFKKFPVLMGATDEMIESDIKVDMSWNICKSTGMIQLDKLISLDFLYSMSHGSGSVGKIWNEHHTKFANFINLHNPNSIIEIGGASGLLGKSYHKLKYIPWTIIEPNPPKKLEDGITFINDFFDENFKYQSENFDTLIHSHLFEHMYEPDIFVECLSKFITENKTLIFSIPNMKKMLELNYSNCLNFEHTIFLTEPYVEYLLNKHGFKLIKKEYFMDCHSIFYSYIRKNDIDKTQLPYNYYAENKELFNLYLNKNKNMIKEINEIIDNTEKDIYLFGAHIFTQSLISFGLNTNKIIAIIDNDINKQDKRLYGTNLLIKPSSVLKDKIMPILILKGGVYNNEVKEDIINNVNNTTIFI